MAANGHTVATYNGVEFKNVVLREFRETPEYDQSGTDLIFTRYSVRIGGIVHGDSTRDNAYALGRGMTTTPIDAGRGAVGTFNNIKHKLSEPGYDFTLTMGVVVVSGQENAGQKLLDVTGVRNRRNPLSKDLDGSDVDNGPKPRVVAITKVVGNNTFWVEFEISCALVDCDDNTNSSGVLSNRWSCSDVLDANFYCTRTYSGILRIAYQSLEPHAFRSLTLPPIAKGMRRDSMSFESSPDGLTLRYTVVDREVTFAPPEPATKWALSHGVSLMKNSAVAKMNATITLEGPPDVNRRELVALVVSSLISLAAPGMVAPGNFDRSASIIEQMDVTSELADATNRVTGRIVAVVQMLGGRVLKNFVQEIPETLGDGMENGGAKRIREIANWPDDYDRLEHAGARPGEEPQSTGPIVEIAKALQGYLQSPCDENHGIESEDSGNDIEETTRLVSVGDPEVPEPVTVSIVPDLDVGDGDSAEVPDEALENVYTHWEMESEYQTRNHVLAMPRAVPSDASPSEPATAFVTVAKPTTRRVITVVGERANIPPELPNKVSFTDSNGIGHVLLGSRVLGTPQDRDAVFATKLYRSEAEYVYGLDREPTADESLALGFVPWADDDNEDRTDLIGDRTA